MHLIMQDYFYPLCLTMNIIPYIFPSQCYFLNVLVHWPRSIDTAKRFDAMLIRLCEIEITLSANCHLVVAVV